MEKRYFDFRDIFQVIRYGFSGRKIAVHFIGLVIAYLIYELLVYLSLFVEGGTAAQDFWNTYALLPVLPFSNAELAQANGDRNVDRGWRVSHASSSWQAPWLPRLPSNSSAGISSFRSGMPVTFLKGHWKSVLGAFIGLILIQIFLALIPLSIAGLGKLPVLGKPFLTVASLFMPIGFFLGVLMTFIAIVFCVSLLFVPAVVAATGADAFETIYQQFAIVWNKSWLTVCYETMLFLIKLVFVPIWAFFFASQVFQS